MECKSHPFDEKQLDDSLRALDGEQEMGRHLMQWSPNWGTFERSLLNDPKQRDRADQGPCMTIEESLKGRMVACSTDDNFGGK